MINNDIFKDSEIICIYHNADFDGICSAEIVRKYFSDYNNLKSLNNIDLKFIGLNYGDKIPYDELINKVIICCDFTPLNFKDIIKKSKYTVWIDHHKSSIEDMKTYNVDNLEKVLSTEYAACEGVWNYFFENKKIPLAVEYLSLFDSFTFTDEQKNDVMCFQYGMKSLGNSVIIDGKSWNDVFESTPEFIDPVLIRGNVVNEYHKEHYDIQVAERTGRTTTLNVPKLNKTYNVIFINSPYCFSEGFKSVYDKEKHDIMMVGYLNNENKWCHTFYGPIDKDIDVSLIAKEFGGGGHKGAAGCVCDKCLV